METIKRYTVTAALPYANGPVHIGHLAGCYLPSDIYVRFLRSYGKDVLFLCGSDEHGVGITLKAKQENAHPKEVVEKYHNLMREAFQGFGISFDVYSRTSSPVHYQQAQEFFKTLYEKNVFVKKKSTQYFDVASQQFLADRYIVGTCPNCSYEKAYGDQCENCGKSLDPTDLINPKSVLSGEKPELRETEHWYLPLQDYENWLKEWILEEHKDWKNNVIGQCRSWLTQGLQERAVTRDLDWGVPVPLEEAAGKVLYVWFDAPIGYISAAKEWAEATGNDWQPYWQDKETKLVHFIGKDNIVFHCIVFPVMLKAHGDYILPDNVPANEFLNIEGDKISTSRNWAVWLHEYLQEFPDKQDVLRYVLCSNLPENKDNDFTWKDFQAKNNNELVAILGNLVNRVIILTHKYFDGKVPAAGIMEAAEADLEWELKKYPAKIAYLIEEYKFREALQELMNLARLGNKYLTDNEPWKTIKTDEARTATTMHYSLQLLANLSILCEPFLPFTSQKLRGYLNQYGRTWKDTGSFHLLNEGDVIAKADILFEKIEDEVIEMQMQKLQIVKDKREQEEKATAAKETSTIPKAENNVSEKPANPEVVNGTEALEITPLKENITFDDFAKLDLRMATIKHAEVVPKTQKLLKLTIDLGLEERTVVSGIAEYFQPEAIIGKQVCIVANLAPRNIRGITSQGMILMIENEEKKLVMLQPEHEVRPGSTVS